MLELPITVKIVPIIVAGLLMVTAPIIPLSRVYKCPNPYCQETWTIENNHLIPSFNIKHGINGGWKHVNNSKDCPQCNDTNWIYQAGCRKEHTVKEGFTSQVVDGEVYKLPYRHEITTEQDTGILSNTVTGIKNIGNRLWQKVHP